jgi:hypothetical protein
MQLHNKTFFLENAHFCNNAVGPKVGAAAAPSQPASPCLLYNTSPWQAHALGGVNVLCSMQDEQHTMLCCVCLNTVEFLYGETYPAHLPYCWLLSACQHRQAQCQT